MRALNRCWLWLVVGRTTIFGLAEGIFIQSFPESLHHLVQIFFAEIKQEMLDILVT